MVIFLSGCTLFVTFWVYEFREDLDMFVGYCPSAPDPMWPSELFGVDVISGGEIALIKVL